VSDNKTPRELYAEQHGEKAAVKVDAAMMAMLVHAVGDFVLQGLKSEGMEKAVGYTIIFTDPSSGATAYGSNLTLEPLVQQLEMLRNKLLADAAAAGAKTPKGD